MSVRVPEYDEMPSKRASLTSRNRFRVPRPQRPFAAAEIRNRRLYLCGTLVA